MKILISGNPTYGLAKELAKLYPEAFFASRSTEFDLTTKVGQEKFANFATDYDVIINLSALWKFNQTVLLDTIYKKCVEHKHRPHIICIGSTTDRVKNSKVWLYNAEKKALRDYCNTLSLNGVWDKGPKITLISFGSLSNVQAKHPDRKCLDIDQAALYIKWVVEPPANICINEISIDPLQVINE
jgi:NADP-dependent 3-hydroxy acid dehydrogenase YdfG